MIEKYDCVLHEDVNDVYHSNVIADELKIKTHYESLDIAGSNKIHYLKFSLPFALFAKEADQSLQQFLKEYEAK